ncbi:STAS domain-containing protein [Streptomyces sp. NPDC040750]|uniref:STAS domain-containing protein n=1 Tax=Streptomyces sp. NPDC040750 TaxID=3154491 RepID=UPI0033D430BA
MNVGDDDGHAQETCSVQVDTSRDGREVVIRLSGEFDLESELDLELVLEVASAARSVELHVAEVRFADSTLLNLLLRMADRFDVRLVGPLRPQFAKLMRLTGVLERFCVHGLEEERPT